MSEKKTKLTVKTDDDFPEVESLAMVRFRNQYAVVRLTTQGGKVLKTDVLSGPADRAGIAMAFQVEVHKYVMSKFGLN